MRAVKIRAGLKVVLHQVSLLDKALGSSQKKKKEPDIGASSIANQEFGRRTREGQ